ncbi:ABC-type oligopeptide transport system substrate-binding subunit [Rhizobium leguminosarum]|uniref:ABC-type oligopeptide transport system substrate-binding subunit n=1 Tax=Rhizobium leguminosarum TaxID=384 RepID=A0AAE2MLC8_RHILE|nr:MULTISPECIES: hypothetical protein [Rhizobium]MBB4291270.1 ABC-type oligopeptide transport system substrate-binding subunit [Rhizobium leguminosarum]MBB4297634.1 ABC-type oligopeptide transport system substrate-binding subunit [Rhizobium leguminosarum]MBB4308774.1 ABC-type oligopeptide transport system substrate-binding subunit [Rhizobium leguminosarum]MBB4416609.1 ABC-type oligopeptide transport system substrate-binding subunit [Rhizobium leguminosarum]MBB4430423.1 ABC-type oligopeptide tr
MSRFFALIATGTLISLATIISACTSTSLDQTSSIGGDYYYESQPLNPACGGGFRPSDGRSCSY